MEKVTYYGETDGIALEQMVRYGKFDMRVKHFHTQYEIFYIVEGERVFFFNNREYIARAGDLILVNSNLIHMTRSVSGSNDGHNRIILYITREKMKSYDMLHPSLQLVRFLDDYYGVYHLDREQQASILNLFRSLRHSLTNREHNYKTGMDLEIMAWLFKLMSFVRRQRQEIPSDSDNPKYKAAYGIADYLSENCERPISLDELADRFYLSKSYICRIFKEVTGYTISEYTNIHRIRKAKRYLEETDMSISQIANALGYDSLTYFERTFKTYMTLSPLKYRKTLNTVTYTNVPNPLFSARPPV
ncbi:MAG: AraC family transcriptional regulator [Lachnospiraceae bacterium]|nr:AraC family transcriptional regulator [Lachnospiraceae bacterium]